MDVMLREFGRYAVDAHRTDLFARAIAESVRPGDIVVDLGTGFGLLALLAARAGASRVYAIEQGEYLPLASCKNGYPTSTCTYNFPDGNYCIAYHAFSRITGMCGYTGGK